MSSQPTFSIPAEAEARLESLQVDYIKVATQLRVMAHPVRLEIITILANFGEISPGALEYLLEQSQPTIAKHLATLRKAGIIAARAEPPHRLYRLTSLRAHAAITTLINDHPF
jgi:DNA-binding transcriptional ArsR family regulator